jgi:hypothetical protein
MPAGPPPAIQQVAWILAVAIATFNLARRAAKDLARRTAARLCNAAEVTFERKIRKAA